MDISIEGFGEYSVVVLLSLRESLMKLLVHAAGAFVWMGAKDAMSWIKM